MKSQIKDANDAKYQLGILQNIEKKTAKSIRRRTPNWKFVMDYLLQHTSKGGQTSCMLHCRFLGVDPDGYSFWGG